MDYIEDRITKVEDSINTEYCLACQSYIEHNGNRYFKMNIHTKSSPLCNECLETLGKLTHIRRNTKLW